MCIYLFFLTFFVFCFFFFFFFFSSRRRHTRSLCDWSSDVCSSDLGLEPGSPLSQAVASNRSLKFQGPFPSFTRAGPAKWAHWPGRPVLGLMRPDGKDSNASMPRLCTSVWVGWNTVWSWPLMVPLVLLHQSRASTLKPNVAFPGSGSIRPPPVNLGPAWQ